MSSAFPLIITPFSLGGPIFPVVPCIKLNLILVPRLQSRASP
jgi:hypothetical protein